ncbi:MAG: N-acyl-D-amino-acid deacylase [Alphaproteobacteria bacterium]|jgi:N-acyl-D-amino-acid deacylase|nr:N-acyl-D-amino-acid deacylase [Alphaproteobacteria bacterium]
MPPDTTAQPDLVIRGALLIDGSGKPGVHGDLAIKDDRIVATGDLSQTKGAREIRAKGLALAPGFIDTHTHDDRALLSDPLMQCKISQGVTTVITGNCGISLAPLSIDRYPPPPLDIIGREPKQFFATFDGYLSALDRDPPALNAACQVGHTTLRAGAMDRFDRAATPAEIDTMRNALETSLEHGAIGMSTGLYYPPAKDAPTAEVIALAKPMLAYGGIHTTHMRDEASHLVQSVNETIEIGRASGVPVVISHHKASGTPNHGLVEDTLKLIDQARKTQKLGLDVYPYVAASTMLDPRRIPLASKIIVTWSKSHPEFAGQTLDAIATTLQCDLTAAANRLLPAGAIYFMMSEDDVRRVLSYPHTMIGSDGLPHDEHPHPRLWGTFPRVLGHYVRDVKLFALEEAVRRMTALPAAQFGLTDRGRLRPGGHADLVLFDPATIADTATFERPKMPAAGIALVMVNGRTVWRNCAATGNRPGRALRRDTLGPMGGGMTSP